MRKVMGVIVLICLVLQVLWVWKKAFDGQNEPVINGDGRGYYAYLPAIFINYNLSDLEANAGYILESDNRSVIKFYSGTAILMFPFFTLGAASAWLSGYPIDGYSLPFQLAMALSALLYLSVGVWYMNRLLKSYGIQGWANLITIVSIVLGTNLLYYVVDDCTASHVYSFATIAAFGAYVRNYFLFGNKRSMAQATIAMAIIILIRPVNILVIAALPFLHESGISGLFQTIKNALATRHSWIVIFPFLAIVAIQPILYFIQSGHWFVWSYADEGFYFSKPQIIPFLIGFKRGAIVYTPIVILAIIGAVVLFKSNKPQALSWLAFFALVTYVLSSWWSWHYGGSFGSRPLIDFYPLLFIPMAILIQKALQNGWRFVLMPAIMVFILLNLTQTLQAHKDILSSWHMNYEKYKFIFGKTADQYAGITGGRDDTAPFHKSERIIYNDKMVGQNPHWNCLQCGLNESSIVAEFNEQEYGLEWRYKFRERISFDYLFMEMMLSREEKTQDACTYAFLVTELKDSVGNQRYYDAFKINDVPGKPLNEWQIWRYKKLVPTPHQGDQLLVYVWNQKRGRFTVKDLEIRLLGLSRDG